jgi:hypothetical protein
MVLQGLDKDLTVTGHPDQPARHNKISRSNKTSRSYKKTRSYKKSRNYKKIRCLDPVLKLKLCAYSN